MYPVWVAVNIGFLVWVGILTYLFLKERNFLRQLFPSQGERDIRQKFKEVLEAIEGFKDQQEQVGKKIQELEYDAIHHIQRIEVSRYNPYKDTGGDQSFSCVLLDRSLNGFILTSLHSRAGTRVYIRMVTKGKSDVKLSHEEETLLEKAAR